jgi:hypothetical protein
MAKLIGDWWGNDLLPTPPPGPATVTRSGLDVHPSPTAQMNYALRMMKILKYTYSEKTES